MTTRTTCNAMKIKTFKKKMLQSRLYRYRRTDRYPPEKQSDYLHYLVKKSHWDIITPDEIREFLMAIDLLPRNTH